MGNQGTPEVRALQGGAATHRLKNRLLSGSPGQSLLTVISSESRPDSECTLRRC